MSFSRRRLLGVLGAAPLAVRAAAAANPATPSAPLPRCDPAALGLLPERLAVADALVAEAVENKNVPGAVLLVGRRGAVAWERAYGCAVVRPEKRPTVLNTIFDLASVTKPVAAGTAIALLIEDNRVDLDAPVARYLPAFGARPAVTVRHLLTHAGGLRAGGAYSGRTLTLSQIVDEIARSRTMAPPGEQFLYSDFSAVTLGAIVETVSGQPLDQFCRDQIFDPLGMNDTVFRPSPFLAPRCAATTSGDDSPATRGRVHDPLARALGGVSGNAGLFSTADDLSRFCQMLLNGGEHNGVRVLKPETVRLMTTKQSPFVGEARGLGWDLDSSYSVRGALPPGSFGHTGFTGTSVWIDPLTQTFVILLTNAVHARPSASGVVIPLRRAVASVVASALVDLPPGPGRVPAFLPMSLEDRVLVTTGLEVLIAEDYKRLANRNVGVVCNHSAVDRQNRHLVDLLAQSGKVKLAALYGPEHSIRGDVDASAGDTRDAKTGLPVFSLYNLALPREQRYRPTTEQLKGVDTLVFDIQDIGARFYTYLATLGYCLEAAAKLGIRVVVLDRPNPLGGLLVEGPLLDPARAGAFTAYHTMPISHGMTIGELAALFNAERKIGADLDVVAMPNWNRRLLWDQTGLPWLNPSPNIRTVRAAHLYPGVGFLEVLPVSVGRGTDTPFEIMGAPFIDPVALEANLSGRRLPGVSFVPTRFTPTYSTHKNKLCGGVQINLWDRRLCRPSELGIHLVDALARLYPAELNEKALAGMTGMIGNGAVPAALAKGVPPAQIIAGWAGDVETWRKRRAPFLRYP